MLTLEDLDFESLKNPKSYLDRDLQEGITEIHNTRQVLGQFTLRDSMEAVYGTAYTVQMLGEDGGNDILVEELTALDDLREANGKKRRDVGGNRLPAKRLNQLTEDERQAAQNALRDQESTVDDAVIDSNKKFFKEDVKRFQAQKVVNDLNKMYPEDRAEIIRLLQEQAR